MKVIFLDIDGVLNSQKYFIKTHKDNLIYHKVYDYKNLEDYLKLKLLEIDFEKIQLLKRITYETNAKIVISSSWRRLREYTLIEEALINKGLPIIDKTPHIGERGEEIRTYLKDHSEIEEFIILDDEIFRDFNELENHLVKTDFYNDGLEEYHVEEAIKILNRKR